jgi:hypothetical protein
MASSTTIFSVVVIVACLGSMATTKPLNPTLESCAQQHAYNLAPNSFTANVVAVANAMAVVGQFMSVTSPAPPSY